MLWIQEECSDLLAMLARSLEQPNNIYGMYFVLVFNNKNLSEYLGRRVEPRNKFHAHIL